MANNLALIQRDITDAVNAKVTDMQKGGLVIAPNYSPANALKSAFFALTNSSNGNLLEKCTKESIANALLDMVVQGLSPAKTQCYFIPYGNTLKLTRSYFGTQKVLKSLSNVEDVWANVIYQGDTFDYEIKNGREKLIRHNTKFENRDNAIIGAYAIIKKANGEQVLTVMTKKEIDKSWSKSKNKSVQNDFPQEMAKRTVINRAAKSFVNTSDDSDLLVQSINNSTQNEHEESDQPIRDVTEEIEAKANQEVLDFEEAETVTPVVDVTPHVEEPAPVEHVETTLFDEEEAGF